MDWCWVGCVQQVYKTFVFFVFAKKQLTTCLMSSSETEPNSEESHTTEQYDLKEGVMKSVEVRGTSEWDENALWVHHYKQPHSHYMQLINPLLL